MNQKAQSSEDQETKPTGPQKPLSELLKDYPKEGVELTEEDREWLDMKPCGKEII